MTPEDWDDLTRWLALASRIYPSDRPRIDEVVKKIARLNAQEKTASDLASLACPDGVQRMPA